MWDAGLTRCAFIGLNPSTADDKEDDQTVKKLIGFARKWGYGGFTLVNLFSLRSTDPRVLAGHRDPVGMATDATIQRVASEVNRIVCCWGNGGSFTERADTVVGHVLKRELAKLTCLGLTCLGQPKHPCRIGYDTRVIRLDPKALGIQRKR